MKATKSSEATRAAAGDIPAVGGRHWLHGFSLFLLSLLITVFLAEVAIPLTRSTSDESRFYRLDSELGWSLAPGAHGVQATEGQGQVAINSLGFRGPEIAAAKPANVFRVAVLGDSFVEAFQVAPERTFLAEAERQLSQCAFLKGKTPQLLNLGVRGYGTAQELISLRSKVWKLNPDAVVLAFFAGNDLYNNHPLLNPTNPEIAPYYDAVTRSFSPALPGYPPFFAPLRNSSALVQLLYRFFLSWRGSPARDNHHRLEKELGPLYEDWLVYSPKGIPEMTESWRSTEALLGLVKAEGEKHRVPLALFSIPGAIELYPDPEIRSAFLRQYQLLSFDLPEERLRNIAGALSIPYISLRPSLEEQVLRSHEFLYGFKNSKLGIGHWNEIGHAAAGRAVADFLCNQFRQAVS